MARTDGIDLPMRESQPSLFIGFLASTLVHMAAVTIQNVSMQFGTHIVLDEVALELHKNEITGLIGANGSGKTTLFNLIAGELTPEKGTITRARGLEIGLLRQEPEVCLESTLHEEVGSVFAPLLTLENKLHDLSEKMASETDGDRITELMESYEQVDARFTAAGGHGFQTRLNEILGGLGFLNSEYDMPIATFSGGQKCRAGLAKLLLSERPFLLLDEPTNHLDIDAVRWLERFLAGHHGGAVIVSHDRYLLDRLCDRIVELDNHQLSSFPGNYSNYAQTKKIRELDLERRFKKDSEFIKKERAFIAKHIAGQRTKEAQGRRKRLERMIGRGEFVTEQSKQKKQTKFNLEKASTNDQTALRCDELEMGYGDNVLFRDLTFQVPAGLRLGITGPNGTGKSTLLYGLLGQKEPTSGTYTFDPKLTIGYYAQEPAAIDPDRTLLEEIRAFKPEFSEQDARTLLGKYMFSKEAVFKPLGALSGGELSRVRLAILTMQEPDVLILDEPTNHLDIPSREALESALVDYTGTIIVVSHDRFFLDRIVDRLLVMRRDNNVIYDGNYTYYTEQLEIAQRQRDQNAQSNRKKKQAKPTRKSSSGPSRFDSMSIHEIEELVIDHETRIAELNKRFGEADVYRNPDLLAELRSQADVLGVELTEIETAWQERVDAQ